MTGTSEPHGLGRALDHLPLPTWVWEPVPDGGFRLAAFNRAALSLSGDALRGAVGRLASELHDAGSPVLDDLEACRSGSGPRQRELHPRSPLYPPGGGYRFLYAPLDDMILVHVEPLADEDTGHLKEPVSFLWRLLGNLPGLAYRCRNDANWTMEFVSPGCEALTGLPAAALVENRVCSFASLIHPDDRAFVWNAVQAGLEDRGRFDVAYRIVRPDGSQRWVWEQGAGVEAEDGSGGFIALEGFITDITDRHELAVELRQTEQQFQILVEHALAGVYLIEDGRFSYVNQRFAEIFGYSADHIRGLDSILELVHPEDREQVRDNLRRRVQGETDQVEQVFRGVRGDDGAVIHVEAHGTVVQRKERPVILGMLLDVTDRMRASERYHQAQKMEALGRLAGGIAHDFNNVLSVIRTLAELLQLELSSEPSVAEDLAEMTRAAERGAALSRQLMNFSRPRPDHLERVSLSDVVKELTPMLERILGADVRLATDLAQDLAPVDVDPSHLEQVVMNLVINARDAMPDGGTLSVRTGLAERGPQARQPFVFVEVQDTGTGMPESVRRRIFEPFYTTKGSQGTGLGLGNVWSITDRYGGSVDVTTVEGVGSTFTVLLPVAPEDTA